MSALAGLALSLLLSLLAYNRSRQAVPSYYEGEVYGLTRVSHRRFAFAGIVFAIAFALCYAAAPFFAVPLFAPFALFAVFYLSSFARGYGD